MYLFCHFFKNFPNFGNRCISSAIFKKKNQNYGNRCIAFVIFSKILKIFEIDVSLLPFL